MESLHRRHRFPPEIISHAVWLYHRFTLSFRKLPRPRKHEVEYLADRVGAQIERSKDVPPVV